jgi:hypothetical protein
LWSVSGAVSAPLVRKGLQAKSVLFGGKNAPQKRTPKQTRAPLGKCVGTASPAAVHEDYNTPGTPTHVLDERRHVESHAAELALSDGTKRTPRANYNSDGRDGWDSHGRHRIPHPSIDRRHGGFFPSSDENFPRFILCDRAHIKGPI